MPASPAHDPIRAALTAQGVVTRDFLDDDEPGHPFLGPLVTISNCEIVYRLTAPGDMLIILYRRLDGGVTPGNALGGNIFADLIAFLLLATQAQFGLRRVLTNPIPWDDEDPMSPPPERLERAYMHLFQAEWTFYDGGLWLYRDAIDLQARMQQLRHKATPLPGCESILRNPLPRASRQAFQNMTQT